MDKENVPQDNANILEGKFRLVKYATERDGSYTKVKTVGWEPENIVLQQAWDNIHEEIEAVRKLVKAGKRSPLAYHMARQMLDVQMVAGYMGYPGFLVRLHLYPWFFRKLTNGQLEKYARTFRIPVTELVQV